MGNVRPPSKTTPSGLYDLHVLVRRDMLTRIDAASAAREQNRSAWLRMAILEKLERDAK